MRVRPGTGSMNAENPLEFFSIVARRTAHVFFEGFWKVVGVFEAKLIADLMDRLWWREQLLCGTLDAESIKVFYGSDFDLFFKDICVSTDGEVGWLSDFTECKVPVDVFLHEANRVFDGVLDWIAVTGCASLIEERREQIE